MWQSHKSSTLNVFGTRLTLTQLWDTAGTERFRSVSRSYYRGAAGAILVYDIASLHSFDSLPTFLNDARALASPNLTVLLAGNKCDISDEYSASASAAAAANPSQIPHSLRSKASTWTLESQSSVNTQVTATPRTPTASRPSTSAVTPTLGTRNTLSTSLHGREVPYDHAQSWATSLRIPYSIECSAYTGDNVDELFNRLALIILTKIELGEIDPDDPASGIQYGDSSGWWAEDGGSVKSGYSAADGLRQRRGRRRGGGALSEWEEVFRVGSRRRGCC